MDGAEGGGGRRRSQVCGMWRSATPLSPRDKLGTVPSNGKLSPPGLKTVDRGGAGRCGGGAMTVQLVG